MSNNALHKKSRRLRGRRLFAITIVLLIGIAAFWLFGAFSGSRSYTGPAEKIRIANIGEHSILNIIAQERGYFSEHGVDATITEYPSGPPAVADLLAGKVNVAVAADFVGVRNFFTNSNLRVIAQASTHDIFKVIARKDKGIADPSDLRGKTIGVSRLGVGEFFLGQLLTFNGIEFNEVQIVDLQPADIVEQLENGTIDVAVVFDPHAYNLKKTLGDSVTVWSAQNGRPVFALLYSSEEFVNAHPALVERYLAALLEAEQFLTDNTSQAQTILADVMKYEPDYVQHLLAEFDSRISLDQALLLTLEDQARFTQKNRLTDAAEIPNYLNFIYFDALEAVMPERISIIR